MSATERPRRARQAYEVDSDDPSAPLLIRPPDVAPGTAPVVVVDNLVVVYHVTAAGRKVGGPGQTALGIKGPASAGKLKQVVALKGVSFTVYHGESVAIVGGNGSGKSTLLRAVAGLTEAADGRIWTQSQPMLLGVQSVMMPGLSGAENVRLGGLALGMSRREVEAAFDDVVEFAGLGRFINLPMNTYSSGMAARLRFAIATAANPEILMVDEALAVGDKSFRERSRRRIRQMASQAASVFLVSHSMSDVIETCTRGIWIDRGRLRADGPVGEVVELYQERQSP